MLIEPSLPNKNTLPRFHLQTALVVMVTWASLLLLNLAPGIPRIWIGLWPNLKTYARYLPEAHADPPRYGFPLAAYPSYTFLGNEFKGPGWYSTDEWNWVFLGFDVVFCVVLLIVVAVVCERRMRKLTGVTGLHP